MTIRMINRLVNPTGTPDMVLNGSGVTNVATTFGVVAVPSNLGTTGNVTLLVYAPGDTNPEIMTMTSRSSLTLTVTREAEEATAYPKCAHAAGAGVWIVETAANLTAFINQLIAATAAPNFSALSDVQLSALANGDVPIWNSGASKWENGPQTGGGGGGGTSGALVLLEQHDAASSAHLDFTSFVDPTKYDDYLIEVVNVIPATAGGELGMRMSTDSGATFDATSGHYQWGRVYSYVAGSNADNSGAPGTDLRLGGGSSANPATGGVSGSFHMYGPQNASVFTQVAGSTVGWNNSTDSVIELVSAGAHVIATTVNAVRFLFHSGNIASGTIRIYGISKVVGGGSGGSGTSTLDVIVLQDQKSHGTTGGTFTSGAIRTRDLNTIVTDPGNHCTLVSNQFTLQPGTYSYHIEAPAYYVLRNRACLYDITNAAIVQEGNAAMAYNGGAGGSSVSIISGRLSITVPTTYEVRHQCESTNADGFGIPSNFGGGGEYEVYTQVTLYKLDILGSGAAPTLGAAYFGKNSIGATSGNVTNNAQYWKKFVLPTATPILNVSAHMKQVSTPSTIAMLTGVFADDGSGKPGDLVAQSASGGFLLGNSAEQGWLAMPIGMVLQPGTYYAVVEFTKPSADFEITYSSGTGHDWVSTAGGFYLAGNAIHAVTDSTHEWDIRVETLDLTGSGSGSGIADPSYFGLFKLDSPPNDWSWDNQQDATVTRVTTPGGYQYESLHIPRSNADRVTGRYRTAPATGTPITFVVNWDPTGAMYLNGNGEFDDAGLTVGFRDSGTGHVVGFHIREAYISVVQWNTLNGAGTTLQAFGTATSIGGFTYRNPLLIRILDDGTNIKFQFSVDGFVWGTFYSEARTTHITPNQVVWGVWANQATVDAALIGYTEGSLKAPNAGGSGTDGSAYMLYQEQQPQNTVGGTFTSGAWQTRQLNVEVADQSGHGVLSGNQITLDAGTYELRGWAMAHNVNQNRLRWRNITDSVDVLYGNSAYMASGTADDDGVAVIEGRFTIATPKVFELQHRCASTHASDGFGTPGNFAVEVYSGVELRRVGDLVAPTVRELILPSNYSIPNGSWGDVTGMSLTLAAGSYLVTGQFAHWNPSNNGSMDIILVDNSGATVYAQTTGSQTTAFFGGTLPMVKKVVLAAATTLKVQARANSAGWLIKTDDQLAVVTAGFGTVLTFTPCN